MTDDEWRDELAGFLDRLHVEMGGDPGDIGRPEPAPEEMAALYKAIAARAAELSPAGVPPKRVR